MKQPACFSRNYSLCSIHLLYLGIISYMIRVTNTVNSCHPTISSNVCCTDLKQKYQRAIKSHFDVSQTTEVCHFAEMCYGPSAETIEFPKTIWAQAPISNCCNYILFSAPFNFACDTNHAFKPPLFDKYVGCWPSSSEATIPTSVRHPLSLQLQSGSLFFPASNTLQGMSQDASWRIKLSQNQRTNYFSEFLCLVIFLLNFQTRALQVRQILDRAFSITRSALECKFRYYANAGRKPYLFRALSKTSNINKRKK